MNSNEFMISIKTKVSTLASHPLYRLGAAGLVVTLFATIGWFPIFSYVILSLLSTVRTILSVALGIGLGLGFATHVYDALNQTQQSPETTMPTKRNHAARDPILLNITSTKNNSTKVSLLYAGDEQTYAALMESAGYDVSSLQQRQRGQVVAAATLDQQPPTYGWNTHGSRALSRMNNLYPNLPEPVREPLALLTEYIMRDFVATWCSKLDTSCVYPYHADGTLKQISVANETASDANNASDATHNNDPARTTTLPLRSMIYSLAATREIPILEQIYTALTTALGRLATRAEHVNVFDLATKCTRVLAHTLRVYRTLRKRVLQKQQATGNSDMEVLMTKEFLLAGALHKSITFGLDVPSLLFADSNGSDCAWPKDPSRAAAAEIDTPTRVLEARLFHTPLLEECVLDYNRVVASRMVRALLPRPEANSAIVSCIITEIVAGCALSPMMSCFCPEYLNGWILQGLGGQTAEDSTNDTINYQVKEPTAKDETELVADEEDEANDALQLGETTEEPLEHTTPAPPSDADEPTLTTGSSLLNETSSPELVDESHSGDGIITMLAMSLIDLQQYVDFDEFRMLREQNQQSTMKIHWDAPGCNEAILKLVLVIEQALTDGRCTYKPMPAAQTHVETLDVNGSSDADDEINEQDPVIATLPEYESTTMSQILMEVTSDIEAFEVRVAEENALRAMNEKDDRLKNMISEPYKPTISEQSTLRTLIAAWLHTGHIFRTVTVLVQAHETILAPFYDKHAFLRKPVAGGFVRQLRALDNVEILVDTMTVLASPRLEDMNDEELNTLARKASSMPNTMSIRTAAESVLEVVESPSSILSVQNMTTSSCPRYLDFSRNSSFATSLRAERDRRMLSWLRQFDDTADEALPIIGRQKGATAADTAAHRELHHIARIFYSSTNVIAIRDAARKKATSEVDMSGSQSSPDASEAMVTPMALLTLETASPRRRIEIPDDDSTFLLRAQPRPLNAVGVHRDQRNHDQSFKCFAATYEEPASTSAELTGGRYIRRCLLRYYPIDRTATISGLQDGDVRKLDQRKGRNAIPDTITVFEAGRPATSLSAEFMKERHLCQRWIAKGTNRTQSLLASSVMEPTDFTAMPRTGKAIEFVYRFSLFEKPMVDLDGNHFTVTDSASLGAHRADASALEISDAALSTALYMLAPESETADGSTCKSPVEMGDDGYPIIWMKFSRKESNAQVEVKPYRLSFIRAALMVNAARHEAQLQNLLFCVRSGSAKQATKALTDARLKPTARLLEYASSRLREKQSVLLRDLKLGVNHIDREQLRRNGLMSPRFPTAIRELTATVEECVPAQVLQGVIFSAPTSGTLYKIRCVLIADIIADDTQIAGDLGYRAEDGSTARAVKEEWIVYRSYNDFNTLHKHLKSVVSISESSGTAGSRLVGAATTAFAMGSSVGKIKQRVILVPSLATAAKACALSVTQRSLEKRREALDVYIKILLAPGHLLNRCQEVLLFSGAIFPLSSEVRPGHVVSHVSDPLGRTEMKRTILAAPLVDSPTFETRRATVDASRVPPPPSLNANASSISIMAASAYISDEADVNDNDQQQQPKMMSAIEHKIDRVQLSTVRNRAFELIRCMFAFEDASFVRNRVLAALKTASFAVTSAADFKKLLYTVHTERLSGDAVGSWIQMAVDLLWPNGEFFTKAESTPVEELEEAAVKSKEMLHAQFPNQLRTILGDDLTRDGMDVLHEVLQNRTVVQSLFYMFFDLLWIEVFPEIGDVLEGGAAVLDRATGG